MTLRRLIVSGGLALALGSSRNQAPKISHPIVLLPDNPHAMFEISAENGCFDFSTDREDLVKLTPKLSVDGCIRSVTVSMNPEAPSSPSDTNPRAVIVATETTSLTELRSEVYFSSISRLEILTRIRRLSVGELEAIQVQASDKFGNTFSSLEGVAFSWQLTDPSTGKKSQIVGVVPLKSTEYALSAERIGLEDKGKQSDLLIVVGWSPGKTTVAVSLSSITSLPVTMSVVENFHPKPSQIAIPFCGKSTIHLFTRSGPITLPDSSYTFSVPSVARTHVLVDNEGRIASLNSSTPVQTSVSITDTRTVGENEETVRVCIGRPTELVGVPSVSFPVSGEGFEFKIFSRSSDCPKMEMEISEDAEIKLELSGGIEAKRTSNYSVWKIPGIEKGTEISISAILEKVGKSSNCMWTPSAPIRAKPVSIRAVERVHASVKNLIVPETQNIFSIAVTGGSGEYIAAQSTGTGCTTTVSGSEIIVTGKECTGTISVADTKNSGGNFDKVNVARGPVSGSFRLGSNATVIEAFIGYERPFTDTVQFGDFYNCSSLVGSVRIANDTIAKVSSSYISGTKACAGITVTQLVPGKTELIVTNAVSKQDWKIPVIVHSPFKIKPEVRLFNVTLGAVVAVNATIGFNVAGGSLSTLRLPKGEDAILLSHPWVADVAVDIAKNKFRVTCRTVGKTTVSVAYSKTSAFPVECVEPQSVIIGSLDVIGGPLSPSHTLFVTCGHRENHILRAIAIDSRGDRLDGFVYEKISWNKKTNGENRFTVPPMDCDTETNVEVEVLMASGKMMKSKSTVKARNTVRSTLGPLLVSKPVYLPCESGRKEGLILSLGFVGGSGYYSIVLSETDSGFSVDDGDFGKKISVGDVGAFNVKFDGRICGNKLRTLTVEDTQLKDDRTGQVQVLVRQLPVTEFVATIAPESPAIVLRNEWTKIDREIKFSDGMMFDSENDGRWFAATTAMFGWESDSLGVELKTDPESGALFLRYTGSGRSSSVRIFSKFFPNISAEIAISVINRPEFVTAFTSKWSLVPVTGNYELEVAGVDLELENIEYFFETNNEKIRLVRVSTSSVLIDPQLTKTALAVLVRFVGRSTNSNREIFSIEQEIEVSPIGQILVNDRSSRDPLIVHKNVAVPFYTNFEFMVPPADLGVDACVVTWTIGTETVAESGQSISYTFRNVGDFPVKANVHCEHLGPASESRIFVRVIDPSTARRIAPLATLMTGQVEYENAVVGKEKIITPQDEGSLLVKVSETEQGVVLFRPLSRIELIVPRDSSVLVGTSSTFPLILKDNLGYEILAPKKIDGLTVGSSRPSIVSVTVHGSKIRATGRSAGCAILFAHLEKVLVGLARICVEKSIVPVADSYVLTLFSEMTLHAAESNPNSIQLSDKDFDRVVAGLKTGFSNIASIDFEKKRVTVAGDIEHVLGHLRVKNFHFVFPMKGKWESANNRVLSVNNTETGRATVQAHHEGVSFLSLGSSSIPVQITAVESLILSPNRVSPATLSHKQFMSQKIFILPLGPEGTVFTASPFIDHKFHHECKTDSSEFFSVSSEIDPQDPTVLICVVTPIVSSLSWLPKKVSVTVSLPLHGITEKFVFPVDQHFHVVAGSFQLPVPSTLPIAGDSIELSIVHLPPGTSFADCELVPRPRLRFIEYSPIGSENGKFSITRTNPSVTDTRVTMVCKNQEFDLQVSFIATSGGPRSTPQIYDSDFTDSVTGAIWSMVSNVLKLVASVLVVAGVAFLFQRTRPPPTIAKEKKSFGRATLVAASPKEFVPHPHPDKDTFFGSSISRRSHID